MIKDYRRISCDFCETKYLDIEYLEVGEGVLQLEESTEDYLLSCHWEIADDMHVCDDCAYKKNT